MEENHIIQQIEVYNFPPYVYDKLADKARTSEPMSDQLHEWGMIFDSQKFPALPEYSDK
ncbi:hypothetical protein [Chryseobacterium vrystaatense]|uniref:hypothetical protein n=1 Tax=Chryseobacterium vrystaatense TaxID=307480 RepID=UPI0009FC60AC|nr:hypothetical protein [Chryseobacterium vrystaatense]